MGGWINIQRYYATPTAAGFLDPRAQTKTPSDEERFWTGAWATASMYGLMDVLHSLLAPWCNRRFSHSWMEPTYDQLFLVIMVMVLIPCCAYCGACCGCG